MKWVAALLVVLGSSAAIADVNELATPAQHVLMEPYAPFKLVGVMPDTGQVLLWDENAMAYRVAKAGEDLDGWRVSGLDLKDPRGPRVALQKEDLIDELELVRLPRPGSVIVFKDARDRGTVTLAPAAAPVPMTAAIPPTVIAAPLETGTAAPMNGAPMYTRPPVPQPVAAPAPLPPQLRPVPAPVPAPPPQQQPAPVYEQTLVIRRGDLDRQMNDFDNLMASVEVAPVDGGGFQLTHVEPGSWVASLGFQQGDVVRTLAGDRVSTVEDAARVYARLRTAASFAAEVERGGSRLILRFEVGR